MWSWTDFVSKRTHDFASYDHRIKVFHLYESPMGEVFLKQVCCTDAEDMAYEVTERSKIEGVQHECLVECLEWRQEQQPNGSGFLYEVYPMQGPTYDMDIRKRCMDDPRYYPEELLWHTLKKFIDVHAMLQSMGFTHHDVKAANIYRQPDESFKIINWGFGSESDIGRNLNCMLPYVSPSLRRSFIMGERDLRSAGDNRAKSNVYSVGVVMLFKTLLDMPLFVTNLKDLQQNIDKRLKDVRYSENWKRALRRLLTVDEMERPDFLQLLDEINRPLIPFRSATITEESFLDDEPLVPYKTESVYPVDPLKVTVTCGMTYLCVNSTQPDREVPCILQLEARRTDTKRPGLDVICVIDVGKGEAELKVVKAGLESVRQRLGDGDRMAIIGYGPSGKKLAKLTVCSKSGKATLLNVISSIQTGLGANLTAGLVSALHALVQCRTPNSLSSIFILGNGAGAGHDQAIATCVDSLKAVNIDQRLSLYCFAPGQNPNFPLLLAMQREASGGLFLVPSEEKMKEAVENTLNLLDSVVIRGLKITAVNENQSPYCSVGSYLCTGANMPLKLPYIVAGQRLEVVFLLSAAAKTINTPMKKPTIRFDIQYKGNQEEDISLSQQLHVWLVPSPLEQVKNEAVYIAYYRRKTALCLFEVLNKVNEGQMEAARDCVRECLKEIRKEEVGVEKAGTKEVETDLIWTEEMIASGRLSEKEWVHISNLATRYYYYGESMGMEQFSPAAKYAELPISEPSLSPKPESPVPPKIATPPQPETPVSPMVIDTPSQPESTVSPMVITAPSQPETPVSPMVITTPSQSESPTPTPKPRVNPVTLTPIPPMPTCLRIKQKSPPRYSMRTRKADVPSKRRKIN